MNNNCVGCVWCFGYRVDLIKTIRRLTGPKKDLAWCRDRVNEGRIDINDIGNGMNRLGVKDALSPYVWFADVTHGEDQDMKPSKISGFSLPDEINDENLEEFAAHLERLADLVRNIPLVRCAYA